MNSRSSVYARATSSLNDGAFETAISYAIDRHRHQVRKVTETPYVAHVLAVSCLVIEHGGGTDEAIAALLHDTIEDADPLDAHRVRATIENSFGSVVLRIVEGCSDSPPETRHMIAWEVRKRRHLDYLQRCDDPSIMLVSTADKLDNARSLLVNLCSSGGSVWEHFSGGREGVLWYYSRLVEVLAFKAPSCLFREFAATVNSIRRAADGCR